MNKMILIITFAALLTSTANLQGQSSDDPLTLGKPRKLHGGFAFTEGPAADASGNVYFTDIPNEKIYVRRVNGTLETFMEKSARCNGLMFDSTGQLWACQGGEGRIIRIDPTSKSIQPVAFEIDGGPFLSTNDLVLDAHGGAYFTDPAYSRHPEAKVDEAVYYVDAKGKIHRLFDGLPRPNGILLSPDGSTLYLLPAGQKRLLQSQVIEPGELGPLETLAELPAGGDGLTCDSDGNLYLTQPRRKSILVVSSSGEELAKVRIPESPSNIAFGGPDLDTLYITAQTSLYELPVNRHGIRIKSSTPQPAGTAEKPQ